MSEIILVVIVAAAVLGLGFALVLVARAHSDLMRAHTEGFDTARNLLKEQDEYTVAETKFWQGEWEKVAGQLVQMSTDGFVGRAIQQHGVEPHLGVPGSRFEQEIHSIQQLAQVDRTEAIAMLRQAAQPYMRAEMPNGDAANRL